MRMRYMVVWMGVFVILLLALGALTVLQAAGTRSVFLPIVRRSGVAPTPTPTPVADLGDAPDSSNSLGVTMTAYTGIQAGFPSVFGVGSPPRGPLHRNMLLRFFLGTAVSAEGEADSGWDSDGRNNLEPRANRADQDGADDGLLLPLALRNCASSTLRVRVTARSGVSQSAYLNVWIDWNRNGVWGGSQTCPGGLVVAEWAVRNQVLALPAPGVYVYTSTAFIAGSLGSADQLWLRVTLSDAAAPAEADDGRGPANGYADGETEDYLLSPYSTATPTPSPTHSASPTPSPTQPMCATLTPTEYGAPTWTPTITPTPAPCVHTATLLSPINGAVLTGLVPTLRFDVSAQPNASLYRLELATNPSFTSLRWSSTFPLFGQQVVEALLRENLQPATRYYWRVRLSCGTEQAPWSAVWSFTTGSGGTLPAAPMLLLPLNSTQGVTSPIMLAWAPVTGTIEYRATWRKASEPYAHYLTWVTSSVATIGGTLDPNTRYEWTAAARNEYGIGPDAAWWGFTTAP